MNLMNCATKVSIIKILFSSELQLKDIYIRDAFLVSIAFILSGLKLKT